MTGGCGNCDRPVVDGADLCSTCSAGLAEALRSVPELVEQLFVSYKKQDRFGSGCGHRGTASEAPLPVRFDITRVIDRLGNEMTTWARDIVDTFGLDVPETPRRRPHNTSKPDIPDLGAQNLHRGEVGRGRGLAVFPTSSLSIDVACYAAGWLAEHISLIRRHPAALEAHRALTGAIKGAEAAMDRPDPQVFIGPCEICQAPLYAERDASGTQCERCGVYIAGGAIAERWKQALRKLRGYPATAAVIAGSIGELYGVIVSRKLINKWHQRHEIRMVDLDPKSKDPRFRIGEVLDRAAKSKHRKASRCTRPDNPVEDLPHGGASG